MICKVFIAASVDGLIAEKDGGIEWLQDVPNPDNIDYGYSSFMNNIDAIVMGRKTFEKVLTFDHWPYDKPVFVLSRTLESIDNLSGKVELLNVKFKDVVLELKSHGLKNLYIDGGLTIQSFLKENLIEEMIITIIPVLLGDGISLFGNLGIEEKFNLVESKTYTNGIIQNQYKRSAAKSE